MNQKPMKSKFGKLFNLAPIAKPREGEVVFLSFEEWRYIRANRAIFTSEKFDEVLRERYKTHHSRIIPDTEADKRREIAARYSRDILTNIFKQKKSG